MDDRSRPGRKQILNRKGLKDDRNRAGRQRRQDFQKPSPSSVAAEEDILAKETEFSKDVAPIHGVALEVLQQEDPDVSQVVASSDFVKVALYSQSTGPCWANCQGPVYLVQRRRKPWHQLLVKNELNTGDLRCQLPWNSEYVCEEHRIVILDADDTTRAYGLFFPEMSERLPTDLYTLFASQRCPAHCFA